MELKSYLEFSVFGHDYKYRVLYPEEVTQDYITSINESRKFLKKTNDEKNIHGQREYIKNILLSRNDTIFGLFDGDRLVGSSGIQNLKDKTKCTTLGLLVIGRKNRGRGLGKTIIWCGCRMVNEIFHQQDFLATINSENPFSIRAFLSCGFKIQKVTDNVCYVLLNISDLKKPDIVNNDKFIKK